MPQVHYTLTADEGRAVQAFLKVVEAQGKATTGFEKMAKRGKEADNVITKLAGSFNKLAGGALGAAGAIGQQWVRNLDQAGDTLARIEKDMASLMTEGSNVFNPQQTRARIFDMRGGWGEGLKQVADMAAEIQNAFGEGGQAGVAEQTALGLSRVMGSELGPNTRLVIKAMQGFGKELDTVGRASDKLFTFATSLSGVEDAAEFLAGVTPDAKRAKLSFDEVAGSLAAITMQGGKTRETAAAAKALFKGIGDGVDQGLLNPLDSYEMKLEKLRGMEPSAFKKLFGEGATAEIQQFLIDLDKVIAKVKELRQAQGGGVGARVGAMYKDSQTLAVDARAALRSVAENADMYRSAEVQRSMVLQEAAKAGVAIGPSSMPNVLHRLVGWDMPVIGNVLNWANLPSNPNEAASTLSSLLPWTTGAEQRGLRAAIQNAERSGNRDLADAMKLEFGRATGTMVPYLRRGEDIGVFEGLGRGPGNTLSDSVRQGYSGPEHRQEFEGLRASGYNLSLSAYQQYLGRRAEDPVAGEAFLKRFEMAVTNGVAKAMKAKAGGGGPALE